ncbi:MAG TPA: DinB family protein [Beijerinckiaceae bacterium]
MNLFPMLAGYNAWANARLYGAAAALSDEEYHADRGAFFGSVHRTLNHILVADRIWLRRFTGQGDAPTRLDAVLYDAFPALREARLAEDRRIAAYVAGLDEERLSGLVTYIPITKPVEVTQPLAPILLHLFNHQTHHRGQIHAILTGLGREAPSLDLPYFQRETGEGMH